MNVLTFLRLRTACAPFRMQSGQHQPASHIVVRDVERCAHPPERVVFAAHCNEHRAHRPRSHRTPIQLWRRPGLPLHVPLPRPTGMGAGAPRGVVTLLRLRAHGRAAGRPGCGVLRGSVAARACVGGARRSLLVGRRAAHARLAFRSLTERSHSGKTSWQVESSMRGRYQLAVPAHGRAWASRFAPSRFRWDPPAPSAAPRGRPWCRSRHRACLSFEAGSIPQLDEARAAGGAGGAVAFVGGKGRLARARMCARVHPCTCVHVFPCFHVCV